MTTRAFYSISRAWVGQTRNGTLSGTTKTAGAPDVPALSIVQLFQSDAPGGYALPNATLVDRAASDASGNYQFKNLNPAMKYNVIAYDLTGQYDPVVKMNLVPTVD